jgi:hypothetical protein
MSLLLERGRRVAIAWAWRVADWVSVRTTPAFMANEPVLTSRKALDNAIARKHPAIDRKLAAYHERSHSGILLGEQIRGVR